MSSITDLEFTVSDQTKFPSRKNIEGPSPFWDKYTEGPSYIKPEDRQKPLVPSGKLDQKYSAFATDLSPLLGTTYDDNVKLTDILDNDELLKDLAIKISQRGVVVFKHQKDLTIPQQKELIQKLGILSGKPKGNGLHIHPSAPGAGIIGENGLVDPELSFITNRKKSKVFAQKYEEKTAAWGWHSDITFEPVPADYSSLRIFELPPTGGDTLWANGYALYEKLSPSLRSYFDTLTGTYSQPIFKENANEEYNLYSEERGAPENIGDDLKAIQPIVRTNPVTGWKTLFAVGHHFTKINEVNPLESQALKEFVWNILVQSHDIQVRHKWGKYDIAIWDNRSTYHTANPDIKLLGDVYRSGVRTVGIAERPYLDPNSITQTEGLQKLSTSENELADSLKKVSI